MPLHHKTQTSMFKFEFISTFNVLNWFLNVFKIHVYWPFKWWNRGEQFPPSWSRGFFPQCVNSSVVGADTKWFGYNISSGIGCFFSLGGNGLDYIFNLVLFSFLSTPHFGSSLQLKLLLWTVLKWHDMTSVLYRRWIFCMYLFFKKLNQKWRC